MNILLTYSLRYDSPLRILGWKRWNLPHSLHLPPLFTTFYHLYCHSTLFTPKLQVGIVDFLPNNSVLWKLYFGSVTKKCSPRHKHGELFRSFNSVWFMIRSSFRLSGSCFWRSFPAFWSSCSVFPEGAGASGLSRISLKFILNTFKVLNIRKSASIRVSSGAYASSLLRLRSALRFLERIWRTEAVTPQIRKSTADTRRETDILVPGIYRLSVRSHSIPHLPSPYPAR